MYNLLSITIENMYNVLQTWEVNIYNLTNISQLCDKYVDIYEELISNVKERYYDTIRDITKQQIIANKHEITCQKELISILPYKYPGRTGFFTTFLQNRCAFAKQYYLPHRFMKSIVSKAHFVLPEKFCDLGRYRSFDFFDPDR